MSVMMILRFKGDPWIGTGKDGSVRLYLGDYSMLQIAAGPFDLPTLNSTYQALRIGQVRTAQRARRRA